MTSVRRDSVSRLERLAIPYFVTGSDALALHGLGFRQTNDIDFVLGCDPGAYEARIRSAFEPDYYVAPLVETPQRWMGAAIHIAASGKADLMIRKPDQWGAEAFARRFRIEDAEVGLVWVSSLEDLLLAKLDWSDGNLDGVQGRDVTQILTSKRSLDWPYVRRNAATLSVIQLLEEALGRAS